MARKILIAADHAGFELKEEFKTFTLSQTIEWIDLGTHSTDSVDYPDFGFKMAESLKAGQADTGVIICGSGIGISIAANRYPHVRAALCTSPEMAELARRHNDANVLALGSRIISPETARQCLEAFLQTDFEGGRHSRRADKLNCSISG